ncbi:MAG: DUF2804 domain-containing protein [Treponemataceae bacterium]|nr:DUF2804 domain-containing protein [Treponemataceae bacterium]
MGSYSKFINDRRRSVPTPKDLVDENGKVVFGTFDKEFETMELLRAKKPTKAPQCFNRLKLTLWEACEVHLKNGVLLAVVCDMGIFGKTMNVFYDKRSKKVYCWDTNLKSKDTHIAPNLIKGAVEEASTPVSFVKYINTFNEGKAELSGRHEGKCLVTKTCDDKTIIQTMKENYEEATIEYDFKLKRLSLPCVASMPFPYSKNRTLYSQKDFFKVEGKLVINGEEMISDEETCGIIDDHRGYYPRRAHYDWVTTMGKCKVNGKDEWLAFNLTRNQSTNQEKYNENLLWLEGRTSLLPPVTFTRTIESKDFKNYSEWFVKDEHDMVNVKFKVYNMNPMIVHAAVVNIDYFISYGELEGYVRDEDGNKYVLDGMLGMGEDKTLLL